MADLGQAARLAVRLQDTRDTVRRFLGADYDARIGPLRDLIRKVADAGHEGVLEVGQRVAQDATVNLGGFAALAVLAATIDEIEGVPRPEAR